MFLGHAGVALALQRVQPKVSLGTLLFAAWLSDILLGSTLLLGWEHVAIVPGATATSSLVLDRVPISHGMVGVLLWAVVLGAVYYSRPTRDTTGHFRASVLVSVAALSHLLLDLVSSPDSIPVSGAESARLGLGLARSLPGTMLVELGLLAAGLWIFLTVNRSHKHQVRPVPMTILTGVLVLLFLGMLFGPGPSTPDSVAMALLIGLPALALLGAWAGRERK